MLITPCYLGLFAVVRHRMMRSIMLSEWVTYDFSTMCSAWHICVDVFVVFMYFTKSSKEKVHFTSKIIYQFPYCHLSRRNYNRKQSCFQFFGFYALFSDCVSWYFIDFMELKSKLCAWIHIFFDVPPTVIKICASQILRLAIRRYALEYTKNALGEKCVPMSLCVFYAVKYTSQCVLKVILIKTFNIRSYG